MSRRAPLVENMDEQGETETTSDVEEPLDEQGAEDETPPEEVIYVVEPARLLQTRERQEPRKYYLSKWRRRVRIIDEMEEAALDASGRKLRTGAAHHVYRRAGRHSSAIRRAPRVPGRTPTNAEAHRRGAGGAWGLTLERLAAVMEQPEADPFDLLCPSRLLRAAKHT